MIRRPRFRNFAHVRVFPPDLVFLLTESGYELLESRLYALLAPLIDGRNTAEDMARRLEGKAGIIDVRWGLSKLEEAGAVVEADGGDRPDLEAFWDEIGCAPSAARQRLRCAAVAVYAFGACSPGPMAKVLASTGIEVSEEDGVPAVVLTDDYLRPELEEFNRRRWAARVPWMMVKPCGSMPSLGPIFAPPGMACWACLAARLRETRVRRIWCEGAQPEPLCGPAPASYERVVLHLAGVQALRWIAEDSGAATLPDLVTVAPATLRLNAHRIVPREGCPVCGSPGPPPPPRPVTPESRAKAYIADGGHRAAAPDATFNRLAHHISPVTGIVRTLDRLEDGSGAGLVHVYIAEHNFSLGFDGRDLWRWSISRKSAGKGMTREQARASALCEALERYSGLYRGAEPRVRATFRELGEEAVHPCSLLNFSRAQYAERAAWNRRETDFNWIPRPFDEDREIEWARVWSLTGGRFRYVPLAYCYYGCARFADDDVCRADSNGCASGASLEDAILQGFLELVERDAVALWWYNRIRRATVDLDSFGWPYFRAIRAHYRSLGRRLWALDITSDLGIPAFAAASSDNAAHDLIVGFGAHFDAPLALSRALAEMNQFLPLAIEGRGKRLVGDDPRECEFLFPGKENEPLGKDSFPSCVREDLRDDVLAAVEIARGHGLEVLALDQTRSDVGLPVVKTIVPGLRQFWARFGPGRLYSVPVEMGWAPEPTTEERLNPVHLAL